MVYEIVSHNWAGFHPLYTLNNQEFFHCAFANNAGFLCPRGKNHGNLMEPPPKKFGIERLFWVVSLNAKFLGGRFH